MPPPYSATMAAAAQIEAVDNDAVAVLSGKSAAFDEVRVPDVYNDLVHASRKDAALSKAVERLVAPFISMNGEAPTMTELHLASNVALDAGTRLSGFVALVQGEAPALPLLAGDQLGTGLTWFRLKDVEEPRLVKDFSSRAAPGFALDASGAPEGRVTVARGTEYPNTVFYLVVEANDRAAAAALREAVAKAGASVKDMVKTSGELKTKFQAVFRASRELRTSMALRFAEAHGLAIDTAASPGEQDTHVIQHSPLYSEASGGAGRDNRDAFLVYDNVVDCSEAHAGVLLFKGPISGYTLITGKQHQVRGKKSLSWDNSTRSRRFSMFPADTGLYLGRSSGRIPDRHVNTSPAIQAAAKERIKWGGDVKSYNPNAELVYHSPTDAAFLQVQTALGAPPGGECGFVTLDTVVTELAGVTTKDQDLPQLIDTLDRSRETELPVKTTSSVFVSLVANWPAVRAHLRAKASDQVLAPTTLAQVFAREQQDHVIVHEDVLRAVHAVTGQQQQQ